MASPWPPEGYCNEPFEYGGKTRDVFRPIASTGPPVLVLHELGGLNDSTLSVARTIEAAGLTPILPVLVGHAGQEDWKPNMLAICVSREVVAFRTGRTSPIVDRLRALAAREAKRLGAPSVGVVGMCFSGGFALAMVVDPLVTVAVSSQPSLPLTWKDWPAHKARDLGLSPDEVTCVRRRLANREATLRVLRYRDDPKSSRARFERLASWTRELGDGIAVFPIPGTDHSVLVDGAIEAEPPGGPPPHPAAANALADVVRHLRERLPDRIAPAT